MTFATTLARSTDALWQRAMAFGFAALVTVSMLSTVDTLANAPLHESPTMAQGVQGQIHLHG